MDTNEADWIMKLVTPKRHTILAGDFNARHTAWGYPDKNVRGRNIKEACITAKLELCNNPDVPTRLAQIAGHNDTSPDLTWVSPRLKVEWQVQTDPMGSDHLPIFIKLFINTSPRRRVTLTKWDDYRKAMTRLSDIPFTERILQALKEARTEYQVKKDTPPPDLHLANLWDRRLAALKRYRTRRSLANKIRLNHATAKAKKYTIELCRTTWHGLCDSFNFKTGYNKVWHAYREIGRAHV